MAKAENEKKDVKSINIEQVVNYLNHTFAQKAQEVFGRAKAVRTSEIGEVNDGTALYRAQVEHCYLIDEIQRGPTYMLPKVISEANEHIANLTDDGTENAENNG